MLNSPVPYLNSRLHVFELTSALLELTSALFELTCTRTFKGIVYCVLSIVYCVLCSVYCVLCCVLCIVYCIILNTLSAGIAPRRMIIRREDLYDYSIFSDAESSNHWDHRTFYSYTILGDSRDYF